MLSTSKDTRALPGPNVFESKETTDMFSHCIGGRPVDFKCPYSNLPLKPLNRLIGRVCIGTGSRNRSYVREICY